MYTIEINSDFAQLYRYNIIISCAGYDGEGKQIYVDGYEKIYSEEILNHIVATPPPPPDFKVGERMLMECRDAESIFVIVYVIAHTLPEDRTIANSPPFDMQVKIAHNNSEIYDTLHKVNQWGGASINIKVAR